MKPLIVVATIDEIAPFLTCFNLSGTDFIVTNNFDVLITGVGMTASAFALGQTLTTNYNLVLNVGIAGSFDTNIPLGSLVYIVEDTFAELGAEDNENFITINQLGFGENTYKSTFTENIDLPKVKGITVNKVHGNADSILKIARFFSPHTESMEGAAVLYACERLSIPCLQVRAISNYVEPRNKENWKIGLAINNLNNWLISFISLLVH
jgi:futalosine hydrolase